VSPLKVALRFVCRISSVMTGGAARDRPKNNSLILKEFKWGKGA